LVVCAVLVGCRLFTTIGEWPADASDQVPSVLRVSGRVLRESMIRRVLQRLGSEELDMAIGAWAARRTGTATTSLPMSAVGGDGQLAGVANSPSHGRPLRPRQAAAGLPRRDFTGNPANDWTGQRHDEGRP